MASLLDGISDGDIGNKAKLTASKNRCKGFRTSFSNKLRAAKAAIDALSDSFSQFNLQYAEAQFEALEKAYEALDMQYSRTIAYAGDMKEETDFIEKKINEVNSEYEPVQSSFLAARRAATKATEERQEQRQTANDTINSTMSGEGRLPIYKTNYSAALKPFTLEVDNTPAELRSWKERMAAYFKSNELDQASPIEQNQYVIQCISPELHATLEPDSTEDAYAPGVGIIDIISKIFDGKYSGFSRRLEMMTAKMKPGEQPMAFVGRMNRLYQEADLANMTIDKYRVFFLVAGLNHKVLRNKILDMNEPSYDDVVAKISAWTVTNNTSRTIEENMGGEVKVKAVKQQRRSENKGPPPPSSIKITPKSLVGRCSTCGSNAHLREDCPKKASAKCNTCGKENHMANVCLAEYIKWRANNRPQKGHEKREKVKKVNEVQSEEESGGTSDQD